MPREGRLVHRITGGGAQVTLSLFNKYDGDGDGDGDDGGDSGGGGDNGGGNGNGDDDDETVKLLT